MLTTHAVGIDLGTTYSCIAYLNEHGEPITLPNQEGEMSTPSVVMFEGHEQIVGTEALRNSIVRPDQVVQNSKRFMGDPNRKWVIDGRPYTPTHIATMILKKLLSAAQDRIGEIEQAVVTVPAQFSEAQRLATIEAGLRAGLKRVDIINEPVAAALCHVLGSEGLWFTELAEEQQIMVYDLGGGTFDLSLVKYRKNEVSVVASDGDLNLGGIDWNQALEQAIGKQFQKEFKADPFSDPESRQYLALEAEQTKRSLTVRPRAAMTCQHGGHRKTYQVEQAQFEKLTRPLVDRTAQITQRMLKQHKMGWAHVDVVLTTGGSSRMPMIRNRLKDLSGRTLNTSLSPDQSIAHGATYYAGMLLTNSKFARSILSQEAHQRLSRVRQKSVNARALGILVRDMKSKARVPHYLIPSNTPLPASITEKFGTFKPNQRRVNLQIVESGAQPEDPPARLGACVIDDLPPNLPVDSEIAVTITYDEQARVHVSARDVTSGKEASTEIVRQENVRMQLESSTADADDEGEVRMHSDKPAVVEAPPTPREPPRRVAPKKSAVQPAPRPASGPSLEEADEPVPLCNECGEPLDAGGRCTRCRKAKAGKAQPRPAAQRPAASRSQAQPAPSRPKPRVQPVPANRPAVPPSDDADIIELNDSDILELPARSTPPPPPRTPSPENRSSSSRTSSSRSQSGPGRKPPRKQPDPGEEDFWKLTES